MLPVLGLAQRGPLLDTASILFAMGAGASGIVVAALYRGMAIGLVSIVAPISATGAALPVVFGLVRGDRATPVQTAGIGLALAGIVLASRPANGAGESTHALER
jgi:uncharacterized membrane protein